MTQMSFDFPAAATLKLPLNRCRRLRVARRGNSDSDAVSIDADGTAHYAVAEGTAAGSTTWAEWNFDFAATTLTAGNDEAFTFKLMVDRDPTAAVNLVEYTPGDNPARFFQNSVNSGFIDTDLATAGAQYYGFADGQFDVMLQAFDGTTLVAQNKVVVHVGDLDDTGNGSFYILLADGLPK